MAGFRTSSTWAKIALFTLILAIVLFVVAFATTAWVVAGWYANDPRWSGTSYWSFGLWKQRICTLTVQKRRLENCYNAPNDGQPIWFHAGQAMEVLGLIFLVIAFILLFLYICVNSMKRRGPLTGIIITTFLAVTFIVIGIAIFITKFEAMFFDIAWSMGLAIAAAVCAFISGIMSLLEICSR